MGQAAAGNAAAGFAPVLGCLARREPLSPGLNDARGRSGADSAGELDVMDFTAGRFPVDLVLFAMIAAFLVLRLRGILGKQTGLERRGTPPVSARPAPGPVIEGRVEPPPAPAERAAPDPSSALGLKLARIRERDRSFDVGAFLRGAEAAFRKIVQAFAEGDRTTLRANLTEAAYQAFDGAISAREAAGETQRAEIRAILQVAITEAYLAEQGGLWRASIDVRFVSDQISMVLGRDGLPVSGADATTELSDLWTFERLLDADGGRAGPNWRLASARSA
jgi:predicted lipid-binding transport protein (Tim44 family)